MGQRERMPVAVIVTATSFIVFGGLLLFSAASDVMDGNSSGDRLTVYGLATLAGMASTAIGLGVAAGRSWARILSIGGAMLVLLAASGWDAVYRADGRVGRDRVG